MAPKVCLVLVFIAVAGMASPFAIEHIIIPEPVKSRHAQGIALGPSGDPMEGVHVQVFDRPELLSDSKISWAEAEKLRHQLVDQMTKADGSFRFDLRPGKYEIRLTRDEMGFDPLSFVLVVEKGSSKRRVCVYMRPEGGSAGGNIALCDTAPRQEAAPT
jgi:hypothetical protein